MNQTLNENLLSSNHNIWQAWILLVVGLVATTVAAFHVRTEADANAKREFDFACNEIRLKIEARLNAHAQILQSCAALFHSSDSVTREEWHNFTKHQRVDRQFQGVQGIGFSLLIPSEQLSQHIQEIRSQGFPEYKVKPEGYRDIYSSIIYIEPFSGRNLRAFGYDMFSEPIRRAAMERARDTASASLSDKVILIQETDKDVQPGTQMYVPVYRKGMPADTVEQRRSALYGWVFSSYRMNDLMDGILGGWDLQDEKQIRLQIFDGQQLALLYDSQPGKELGSEFMFILSSPIDSAGRHWTLRFIRVSDHVDYSSVWLFIYGGTIISLLIFGLNISLLNTRFKARKIAEQLTIELSESEDRYRRISSVISDIAYSCSETEDGGYAIDWITGATERITGYSADEIKANRCWRLFVIEDDLELFDKHVVGLEPGSSSSCELRLRHKDCSIRWLESSAECVLSSADLRILRLYGGLVDITDRKQVEEERLELERIFYFQRY